MTALLKATGDQLVATVKAVYFSREREWRGFIGLTFPIPAVLQETKVGAFPSGWTIFPWKSL